MMRNFIKNLLFCCLLIFANQLVAQTESPTKTNEIKEVNRSLYYSVLIGFMPGFESEDSETSDLRGLNLINFMIGHRFNQYAHLGGGVAWDSYDMGLLSFRLDFKGFILNEKSINPYYSLQTGYGFATDLSNRWDDRIELKGGPLIHPALGIKFNTRKAGDILLEAGYIFQKASRDDPENLRFDDIVYRRFNIRFGLIF